MHLKQLKLSGFKSFADPTTIEFPSALCGIVGPNGCGKSNVIDAIRWVLGEGRASELRGQSSMTDLIFAGSEGRPPASRASCGSRPNFIAALHITHGFGVRPPSVVSRKYPTIARS